MESDRKPRALVFIVAYYAESTILEVLDRIPEMPEFDVEVLLIDDSSQDGTFDRAQRLRRTGYRYPLTVLANPINQGYGGNQKLGYHFAVENQFDFVALLHGDGQYAPEILPTLFEPLRRGEADVVLGSRMVHPVDALRGGMPFYKFVGNRVLTWYQNLVLGTDLAEFHTGYKAYSVEMLRHVPFDLNSNAFHFDTELIIQFLRARARITELPIPTHYGDEICRVNGIRYALDVINASTVARLQDYGLVYRRNFDVRWLQADNSYYVPKLGFRSTHSIAVEETPAGSTVLDLGCGPGHLCGALKAKGCRVIGVDQHKDTDAAGFDEFYVADLNINPAPLDIARVDVILLLDIIEHLASPEKFCDEIRRRLQRNLHGRIIISTANVAFVVPRLMLLLGQFNYNKRGILDLTHTRLFTFSSLRRLFKETGFVIEKEMGVPAPIPLAVKSQFWSRWLMRLQRVLIGISRRLFAYQILMVIRPLPTLETLLKAAHSHTEQRESAVTVSA